MQTPPPQYWGHRFCGACLQELVVGQWFWIVWHDLDRAEGQASSRTDALCALDHFLEGRRGAGRTVALLAERAAALSDTLSRAT